jgi:hypothetical protein
MDKYYKLAIKIGKLNKETIRKAKELNIKGRTLLGYVKSAEREKWKLPADEWINELYTRKFK